MEASDDDLKRQIRRQNRFPRKQVIHYLQLRITHADELRKASNAAIYKAIQTQMYKEFGVQRSVRNLRDKYSHLKYLAKVGRLEDDVVLQLIRQLHNQEMRDECIQTTYSRIIHQRPKQHELNSNGKSTEPSSVPQSKPFSIEESMREQTADSQNSSTQGLYRESLPSILNMQEAQSSISSSKQFYRDLLDLVADTELALQEFSALQRKLVFLHDNPTT